MASLFFVLLVFLPNVFSQGEHPSHIDTSLPATYIGPYLKGLARRELGVDHLQDLLNVYKEPHKPIETKEDIVQRLARNLETKIIQVEDHLANVSRKLLTSLQNTPSPEHKLPPCCSNHPSVNDQGCSVIHLGFNGTRIAKIAANVFDNQPLSKGFVRQFFMSRDRTTHLEYPAMRKCGQQAYTWHRDKFIRSVNPMEKNVLILLDRGNALSTLQLDIGRAIAGFIIDSLSINDQIALLTLDSHLSLADNQDCDSWSRASDVSKKALHLHLNSVSRLAYKNHDHVQAMAKAKEILEEKTPEDPIDLFFITASSSMTSPDDFVKSCELLSRSLPNVNIQIFLMDRKRVEGENVSSTNAKVSHLLQKLAHSCDQGHHIDVKILDSTLLLSYNIGALFEDIPPTSLAPSTQISVPWSEDQEDQLLISFTIQLDDLAILGVDVDYSFLFEDYVFEIQDDRYYLIILDQASKTILYHPEIERRPKSKFPQGINLRDLEDVSEELEEEIFRVKDGFSVVKDYDNEIESMLSMSDERKYFWRHVRDKLIVVLVKPTDPSFTHLSALRLAMPSPKLSQIMAVYHRLDLLSPQYRAKLCLHLHYPATLETGSVFLAPYAFYDPYAHLSSNVSEKQIMTYMRYLTSSSDNRPSPGLRPIIREDLQLLSQVLSTWRNMSFSSGMNNYIVRRFSASRQGVYFAYPGSPVPNGMDPTRQDWYLTSIRHPGRVILTRPRLDHGGAGFVLTLGKHVANDHFAKDDRGLVMGMDLTIGYVNKMLLDTIPICRNLLHAGVRCFLFDHKGYIIVHPHFFDPKRTSNPIEGLHMTHVEHLAMTLMMKDPTLVQRKHCRQYSDMTIQHFYHFNTSSIMQHSLWTNSDNACLRYQVSLLPDTNVFLGIVLTNSSCSDREAITFCPCSVTGRQCILCEEETSTTSCECPCECPLSQCHDDQDIPLCPENPQKVDLSSDYVNLMSDLTLPPCFDTDCGRHLHEEKCFGIIGCSWCKYQRLNDDLQSLAEPFCSNEAKCFGGILGAPTPYDQYERGSRMTEEEKYFFRPKSSVAPIAGTILSAILFLGLSGYCIRNFHKCACVRNTTTGRRQRHGSMLQVATFEEVIEDNDNADELHELDMSPQNAIIVSPYRVNPGYRRPAPGTDSDHGYSTMTPMGDLDSEIVPYIESSSARSRLQRLQQKQTPSSIQSVTSGVSSRTSSPIPLTNGKKMAATELTHQSCSMSSEESPVSRGAVSNKPVGMTRKNQTNEVSLLSESSEEASLSSQQLLDPQTMLPRANKNQFIVAATVHMVDT